MQQYLDLVKHVLENGEEREDRTGTGTISTFGYQMRFNLAEGFPLLTTKKVFFKGIVHELLWFLNGDTDIKYLNENGVKIWNGDAIRDYFEKGGDPYIYEEDFNEWVTKEGYDLGPIYGEQWRSWQPAETEYDDMQDWNDLTRDTIDQIANVIESIKNDPNSRSHIVSAWNVGDLNDMVLKPCHVLFQFYVTNDGRLSCHLYQRSADVFLGLPFNIASYALLTQLIARETGLRLGEFIHSIGDAHIYKDHIEKVKTQLKRKPKELPKVSVTKGKGIDELTYEDIKLVKYNPHGAIKGQVSN